ncbi:arginase family protein, partial [Janthinobacterium sp. PSPC3-1]|uniref:arginase family protein n=1 Tax=Janthinobacterium sp. PSPC3-1 TaxID=2804653 RepID=UPI003CE96F18
MQVDWIFGSTGVDFTGYAVTGTGNASDHAMVSSTATLTASTDPEQVAADADVVVLGAPFDGGTSHRPGTRFGPQAIRMTDYLPHDGSRPSLALRTDGLQDLRVVDAGDVELPPGDIETTLGRLEAAVEKVARSGAIPVVLGGDHINIIDTPGHV